MTALPAFMTTGAWWDGSTLTDANAWTDRVGGLVLAPVGGRTTTISNSAINSKRAMVFNQKWNGAAHNAYLKASGTPMGATPTAFSMWALVKTTAINQGQPGQCFTQFAYIGDGGDGLVGYSYFFMFDGTVDGPRTPPAASAAYIAEAFDTDGNHYWDTAVTPPADPTAFCFVELVVPDIAALPNYRVNGVAVALSATDKLLPVANLLMNQVVLGGFAKDSDPEWNLGAEFVGQIAHFGCTPYALSASNRQALYDWLTAEYAITLPSAGAISAPSAGTRRMKIGLDIWQS